jgi:hypothetical protein
MMRVYVESSEEHETIPGYTSCQVLQQKMRCGSVMSPRSTFCSKHLQVRELRKKGVIGSGT